MESSMPSRPILTEPPATNSSPAAVDSDREESETCGQPPRHFLTVPRVVLPSAPQQQAFLSQPRVSKPLVSNLLSTPKRALGFPPINQQSMIQCLNSLNRIIRTVPSTQPQQQQHQDEGYPNTQAPAQSQTQAQSHMGGYSSTSNGPSSYYTSGNQRNTYQHQYMGDLGQLQQSSQAGGARQRTRDTFGTTDEYMNFPYSSAYMNELSAHPYSRERPEFDNVHRDDNQYHTFNPQLGDDYGDDVDDDDDCSASGLSDQAEGVNDETRWACPFKGCRKT